MDDPLHYANIQLMVLATDLRKVNLQSINDIESTIGKLQVVMHQLFCVKQQVESMESQANAHL